MDLYSRRIVGWAFGTQPTKELVIQALEMGVKQRKPASGLIFHSDKGSQYTSYAFRDALERHHLRQSHAGTGNCFENAKKERFYRSLKGEHLDHLELVTREQAQREVFTYIEMFYNRERIHTVLGNLSPLEFERETHPAPPGLREAA